VIVQLLRVSSQGLVRGVEAISERLDFCSHADGGVIVTVRRIAVPGVEIGAQLAFEERGEFFKGLVDLV